MFNSNAAPKLPARIESLDGLRGFSVLLVILGHVAATNGAPEFSHVPAITSLGNVGVRFFFLISGFLITTLLLRERDEVGTISLRNFYWRRSLRILPAFLTYVLVIWLAYLLGQIDLRHQLWSGTIAESALPSLLQTITFTANYNHDYNWYFNHLWSLSVEEQFYLLWPLALVFLKPRTAIRVGIALILIVPFIRYSMYLNLSGNKVALSREFQAVCDSLVTGSLTALLHNFFTGKASMLRLFGWPAIPISFLLVGGSYGIAAVWPPAAYIAGQSFANIGIALFLQHLVRNPQQWPARILQMKWLIFTGTISYSLYLWQEPFTYFRSTSWLASFPQNIVLAFIAAYLSYRFIELPFLKLKSRGRMKRTKIEKDHGTDVSR